MNAGGRTSLHASRLLPAVEILAGLDADGADAYAGRGWLHLMKGEHRSGTAALREALRRAPGSLLAHLGMERARTLYHPGWRLGAVVSTELEDWGGIAFLGVVLVFAVFHDRIAERVPVAFPFIAAMLSLPLVALRVALPTLVRRHAPEISRRVSVPGTLRRSEALLGQGIAVAVILAYLAAVAALVLA